MSIIKKYVKQNLQSLCKPTIQYVKNPKKHGGKTRIGRISNSMTEIKYAEDPYAWAALSLRKSTCWSRQMGIELRLIKAK
mmetsp:Transcript_15970/g.40742  ORF Transcript_15970/g.40742 Transcript_15970/m.40742 type:complete len:80 (-) Transcript_15970:930-1169(-)